MALPMKAMKAPAMKRQAMKKKAVSKIARGKGAKSRVFKGKKEKTVSGLQKSDLMVNKRGKVVSKKAHAAACQRSKQVKWIDAVMAARKELNINGYCSINGKSAEGKAIYVKAKSIYSA